MYDNMGLPPFLILLSCAQVKLIGEKIECKFCFLKRID